MGIGTHAGLTSSCRPIRSTDWGRTDATLGGPRWEEGFLETTGCVSTYPFWKLDEGIDWNDSPPSELEVVWEINKNLYTLHLVRVQVRPNW